VLLTVRLASARTAGALATVATVAHSVVTNTIL
jgi:hypothetical protein